MNVTEFISGGKATRPFMPMTTEFLEQGQRTILGSFKQGFPVPAGGTPIGKEVKVGYNEDIKSWIMLAKPEPKKKAVAKTTRTVKGELAPIGKPEPKKRATKKATNDQD